MMREYMQKKQASANQIQSSASRQASAVEVLQNYKKKIVQMQAMNEEELLQGKFDTAQREGIEDDELLQAKSETTQREETVPIESERVNNTGLPDNLKSGIENLSGYSMDDVRVHYNSSKPAQLQALAYAQGTDIHVAPGQEQHLPHEAWHVVQQKQGRVQPTTQLQGVNVNDNEGLEKEADVMGEEAIQRKEINSWPDSNHSVVQMGRGNRKKEKEKGGEKEKKKGEDYVNNIGALFRELTIVELSPDIIEAIDTIDRERPNCTVETKEAKAEGPDTNIDTYSAWVKEFRNLISYFFLLLSDSDEKYIKEKLEEKTLFEKLEAHMKSMGGAVKDNRVQIVINKSTHNEKAKAAMGLINGAINKISDKLVSALREFAEIRLKMSGDGKENRK